VCFGGSRWVVSVGWTLLTVELLLPPRQSRGPPLVTSAGSLLFDFGASLAFAFASFNADTAPVGNPLVFEGKGIGFSTSNDFEQNIHPSSVTAAKVECNRIVEECFGKGFGVISVPHELIAIGVAIPEPGTRTFAIAVLVTALAGRCFRWSARKRRMRILGARQKFVRAQLPTPDELPKYQVGV